jgi:hypothetical protein
MDVSTAIELVTTLLNKETSSLNQLLILLDESVAKKNELELQLVKLQELKAAEDKALIQQDRLDSKKRKIEDHQDQRSKSVLESYLQDTSNASQSVSNVQSKPMQRVESSLDIPQNSPVKSVPVKPVPIQKRTEEIRTNPVKEAAPEPTTFAPPIVTPVTPVVPTTQPATPSTPIARPLATTPNLTPFSKPPRIPRIVQSKNICFDFNSTTGCENDGFPCMLDHYCAFCGNAHSIQKCPIAKENWTICLGHNLKKVITNN